MYFKRNYFQLIAVNATVKKIINEQEARLLKHYFISYEKNIHLDGHLMD